MNKMIWPKHLNPGDNVALVAPSSPLSDEKLKTSINSIIHLGLNPIIFPSCHMHYGYLAGHDFQRAEDINKAFSDKEIKGIFCLRGGYGASRILPMIDFNIIKANPKVFIGYSDITALHTAINKFCNLITFHGPMPTADYTIHEGYTLDSLKKLLFATPSSHKLINPKDEIISVIVPGRSKGMLTGGNLSLLAGTLGSPYEIDTKGKILFIEDVDEEFYVIDKSLTALALAGKFKDCEAVILGTFERCIQGDHPSLTLSQIIEDVVAPWKKTTILNLRSGHIYPQMTLPMGAVLSLITHDDNSIDISVL